MDREQFSESRSDKDIYNQKGRKPTLKGAEIERIIADMLGS